MQSLFSARSGSANSKNDSELSPIYTAQPRFTCRRRLSGGESHRPGQTTAETLSDEVTLDRAIKACLSSPRLESLLAWHGLINAEFDKQCGSISQWCGRSSN